MLSLLWELTVPYTKLLHVLRKFFNYDDLHLTGLY